MINVLSNIKNACEFLTIITFPFGRSAQSGREMAGSMAFFPLIGLVIGGFLLLLSFLLNYILPWQCVSAVVLAFYAYITGGIHLDGVADTLDGMYGGKDRKSALLIMRDSRIGAIGSLGIIFIILLKFAGLANLTNNQWILIFLMPLWGRWTQLFLAWRCGYARKEDGLGKPFLEFVTHGDLLLGSLIMVAPAIICLGLKGLIPLAAVGLSAFVCSLYFTKKLGGVTGDVMGGCGEFVEVFVFYVTLMVS